MQGAVRLEMSFFLTDSRTEFLLPSGVCVCCTRMCMQIQDLFVKGMRLSHIDQLHASSHMCEVKDSS